TVSWDFTGWISQLARTLKVKRASKVSLNKSRDQASLKSLMETKANSYLTTPKEIVIRRIKSSSGKSKNCCSRTTSQESAHFMGENGAAGEIRTLDLVLRRHALYPSELQPHASFYTTVSRVLPCLPFRALTLPS